MIRTKLTDKQQEIHDRLEAGDHIYQINRKMTTAIVWKSDYQKINGKVFLSYLYKVSSNPRGELNKLITII